jgi:hypothetical protein
MSPDRNGFPTSRRTSQEDNLQVIRRAQVALSLSQLVFTEDDEEYRFGVFTSGFYGMTKTVVSQVAV